MSLSLFRTLRYTAVCLAIVFPATAEEASRIKPSPWEQSVVTIEVARKQYDYYQPWSKQMRKLQKVGTVISDHEILTTADHFQDRTLIRLQKGGRGKWFIGEVSWLDYHANLALVTTSEADFWRDLKPVNLGGAIPPDGALQILRWREGNLENRRAEFTQFAVREGQLSPINQVTLEAASEIQAAGWGEPIVADSHLVGLLRSQDNRNCMAIPASLIQTILEAHKQNRYHGLGFFHFYWQPSENPATLASLKLAGEPRGVVVIDVPDRPDGGAQVVKTNDILLRIDGFDLDIEGDYNDPEFGHLNLENLAVRRKWAGEDVKIEISREGKTMEVVYRLPKFEYTNSLVPFATYDQEPEYLIVGGLVFQPLTDSYLQAWGQDWKVRAPFRLNYYNNEPPSKERPALVLLSQVLPDPYNIGYQDQRWLILDKVNGQRVNYLPDVRAALRKATDGYHLLEFVRGDSLQRIVLSAGDAEQEATARVLQRYNITDAFRFAPGTIK